MPRCGAWRCGRRAIRRPLRHWRILEEDNGADGFFLDIEGAAHLFGGEEKLLADLAARLRKNFGLPARLAVAETPGAAWALSRFHETPSFVLPSGQEAAALAPLPIAALRLAPETRTTLRRLGFKTVGSLLDKPRAPFAARFPDRTVAPRRSGARPHRRAAGRRSSRRRSITPALSASSRSSPRKRSSPTPAASCRRSCHVLDPRRCRRTGFAALPLQCRRRSRDNRYRADAADAQCRHVARLIDLKLEALAATLRRRLRFRGHRPCGDLCRADAGTANGVGPLPSLPRKRGRVRVGDGDRTERCAALIDALRQRLGPASVRRFEPVASHLPERAEVLPPIDGDASAWPEPEQNPRPLLLLPHAEPAEDVTALVPDGPPRRFSWRGVTYDITGAQGPGTHRRRMVAATASPSRHATTTSSRIPAAIASGFSAKDFMDAKRRRRAGSCTACLRE